MADRQLTPEEEQNLINQYWNAAGEAVPGNVRQPISFTRDAPAPVPAAPAPIPYQPNPGAPGYNPNPGATTATPATPQGALLGAPPTGPRPTPPSPHPLFQNPFQTPVDMGEVDAPPALDFPAGPATPPATGPTAADDAAFESFRSSQPTAADKKIASYYAGGGGGAARSNPDPYGIAAAQQGQLDALGQRSDAMRRAADADAVKAVQIAEGQRDLARMQEEDAAIGRAEADETQRHFAEGMAEIGRQLDDVRARKIDPLRQMKESPALGVLAVIGGALGGFYQGISGGQTNEFITALNRQLDRGYEEDLRQVNDQKYAIGQASNLLSEQRAIQKDHDLARLQYRNLTYEAAKQQIAAEAATNDVPGARARADELIAQVEFEQKKLAEEIGRRKLAQAQAAGAASFAQAKEVRDFRAKIYEKMLSEGYSPAQAETEARRQVAIQYLGNVGPRPRDTEGDGGFPLSKSGRDEIAKETHRTILEAQGLLKSFDSFDPQRVAAGGVIGAHLPNAMKTQEMKADFDERERYNSLVRPAVGAAWRLQTHSPEPRNIALLDEQAEAFKVVPTDSAEDVARKMRNLQQHVVNAAKSGGVELPDARASAKVSRELGAKPVR